MHNLIGKKVLYLTLSKEPFDLMRTGVKRIEIRRPSDWIIKRLVGKDYDYVHFRNGYSASSPYFIAEYKGYFVETESGYLSYPGNICYTVKPGDYVINLGSIVSCSK